MQPWEGVAVTVMPHSIAREAARLAEQCYAGACIDMRGFGLSMTRIGPSSGCIRRITIQRAPFRAQVTERKA
jgi:hypothetical protein